MTQPIAVAHRAATLTISWSRPSPRGPARRLVARLHAVMEPGKSFRTMAVDNEG